MSNSLKEKSVLVTGGSSGIGLGIAQCFAEQGCQVAITGRSIEKTEAVAAALRSKGHKVRAFALDVTDSSAISSCIQQVADSSGGLDVLCSNAGIFPSASLESMTSADWDLVMNTNAKGSFLCVQAALPYLKKSKQGRVVLTSSITGPVTGFPGWSHYAASKAAQLGFMRTAAIELSKFGVTVNAVLPGNIMTEGLQNVGPDYIASMAASIPLKRLGSVQDIGNAAVFFASEQAGFITGQTLIVDGGQILPESLQALT